MLFTSIVNLSYLIGALAFVVGLRRLSSPDTAQRGNLLAGLGMGLAILATLFIPLVNGGNNNYAWIILGMIAGSVIGWISAKKVQMTAMPQMVSIFNGLGGACAVVLGILELLHFYEGATTMSTGPLFIVLLALVIGGVSFTGSMLAFGKLQGLVNDSQVTLPGHTWVNIGFLIVTSALTIYVPS